MGLVTPSCGVLLLACVVLGAGCSYGVISGSQDAPSLPVMPDAPRVQACERCASTECVEQRAACLDDTDCSALLSCKGRCSDPGCLQTCTAKYGFSPGYDALWGCVMIDACATACVSGENFACVGSYDAPRAADASARFPVLFHLRNPHTGIAYSYPGAQRDEEFAVGAAARSCSAYGLASSECQLIDSGQVDARNAVALDVTVQPVSHRYAGVVEFELDDTSQAPLDQFRQYSWRDRYMPPPFAQATEFRFYVFWRGWILDRVQEKTGQVLDFTTAAPLAIYMEDCTGAPARGVRFELAQLPKVDVLHQLSDGTTGDETDTGAALVGDIPTASRQMALDVQAVQVATGDVLAKRSDVYVRSGWSTHVWLTPTAKR